MEKKQSSIDWLIEQISYKSNDGQVITFHKNISYLIEQAKAMHKEESELLFECGRNFQLTGEGTFNQVYNETFGGNNE